MSWINNVRISSQATAVLATYLSDDRQADLIVIEFDSQPDADEFFSQWSDVVSEGLHISQMAINLPGWLGQGRIQRGYNTRLGKAYSAWQNENWITILEVPGSFSLASPMAQEIKQLVSQSYIGDQ